MQIKRYLFPALLACAALTIGARLFARPAAAATTRGGPAEDVNGYIQQQMSSLGIPGAALVVVEGDQIVQTQGFGRSRPGGSPPAPATPFVIGSLTKSFTALAVMQLVEAGRVDLDAPIQTYLPWFTVADPQAAGQITVRHLLNQTSGLPQLPGMLNLADFDSRPGATERQMRALASLTLTHPVGAAFEYSNLNYNLLGLIIEAASGETYAGYIQRHIFAPLEMTHSYTEQAAARQDGLAVGHVYWFGAPLARPELPLPAASLPSGQLIASSEDMGRYLIAHLNAGRYGDGRVISATGAAQLHHPVAPVEVMGISMGRYAMGWFVDQPGAARVIWHNGTTPDFFAFMALLPDQNKGVALLLNANHVMIDKMALIDVGMGVARRLAGETPAPAQLGALPWALRGLLLIPLLQIAGVALTLRRLHRWRREPTSRPAGWRKWLLHIGLPLLPNLALLAAPLAILSSGLLAFMRLFAPDITWLSLVSGGFAGLWAVARTGLILRA